METKIIVESLLFNLKNKRHLRSALELSRIINNSTRIWVAKNHPEISIYTNKFINPVVITTIGLTISTFIIEQSKGRLYSVLEITGPNCSFYNVGKNKLAQNIKNSLNIKDFLPNSYVNQIIYIPKPNKNIQILDSDSLIINSIKEKEDRDIDCFIFTEYKKGFWTIDGDISIPEKKTKMKTSSAIIIKNIMKEL